MAKPIPDGYNSVTPRLIVNDAVPIDVCNQALGAMILALLR